MKILAIRIKNLASLEGITEIDFTAEPLCSSGIFAITGATGAGKSTILDALCLALYGKTPRYLQAKEIGIEVHDVQGSTLNQGDVRGILRDGTADGFAEVDFRGTDGQDYRSNWSVRRARNKAEGSMQSDSITLKNITSNVDIPGKKQETLNEITRLVGLNFDQFIRSVLLAQGDFTAFMKASKDEKSSLLEKLTGTHIYSEISKKIYEKFKIEEQLLRDLNLRKEGIAILTEEEISALLEEQSILESQIKVLDKDLENLTLEINWHEQLSQLQSNYAQADTALNISIAIKTDSFPRKQKLLLTEQAQQTRSWADALANAKQRHIERTSALVTLKESIASLIAQKEKLEIQLLSSGNELTTQTKSLNNALPLFEQAKKLDTLLTEKAEQLVIVKEEAESADKANSTQQQLLADKNVAFTTLVAQIKTQTDWKLENAERSPIAENREIILSKLIDAQELLANLLSSTETLEILTSKIKISETEKTAVDLNFDKQTQKWESSKKIYGTKLTKLSAIAIETINQDKEETDQAVGNTIKAQANWQLLYNAIEELSALTQKQTLDQSNYKKNEETLQELAKKLLVENAQKETTAQLLQQARLASAENVETLRSTLIDDEPCPVCGSKNHPYTTHNPQLENVLAKLGEAFEEKERVYLTTYRQHNALEQAFDTLKQTIQTQCEAIETKTTALEVKKQTWVQFDIANESQAIQDKVKGSWIEDKLQILKTKQSELLILTQAYTTQKQQLEVDKNKIDLVKETIDSLTNQAKDIKLTLALYQEQQNATIKNQNKATLSLSEIEKTLSPYFTNSDWMENWKAAPTTFVDRIDAFAKKWRENTEKLVQCTMQKGALEATIKELESQAKSFLSEFNNKTKAYTTQNTNYLDLKRQRNSIFGGESVDKVDNRLKQAVSEAQKQVDQLKETKQELATNSTKADTQKEELLFSLSALEAEAQKASEKMEGWLNDYNKKNNELLDIKQLHELLLLNNNWLDAERITLKAIDEEVIKSTTVLAERKQSLNVHQQKSTSKRQLGELKELATVAKADSELQKRKKTEIGFQLQLDQTNKNKIGDLLKSITTQADINENWSKLNEIIGSADGKKFRQIAQEYTLDVLLGYANIHLQALTSRYKIERIPTSLGLQVVDQDMGDEVRTVYSLSGGESFLVSLALALGLASLSSSKMKVESLFIDEGFGSLDPTTLNIAMDALERLHNQGRKVGVISHVQEMTERIPVQIKVSKQQSGKSKVEVLGI